MSQASFSTASVTAPEVEGDTPASWSGLPALKLQGGIAHRLGTGAVRPGAAGSRVIHSSPPIPSPATVT